MPESPPAARQGPAQRGQDAALELQATVVYSTSYVPIAATAQNNLLNADGTGADRIFSYCIGSAK